MRSSSSQIALLGSGHPRTQAFPPGLGRQQHHLPSDTSLTCWSQEGPCNHGALRFPSPHNPEMRETGWDNWQTWELLQQVKWGLSQFCTGSQASLRSITGDALGEPPCLRCTNWLLMELPAAWTDWCWASPAEAAVQDADDIAGFLSLQTIVWDGFSDMDLYLFRKNLQHHGFTQEFSKHTSMPPTIRYHTTQR